MGQSTNTRPREPRIAHRRIARLGPVSTAALPRLRSSSTIELFAVIQQQPRRLARTLINRRILSATSSFSVPSSRTSSPDSRVKASGHASSAVRSTVT